MDRRRTSHLGQASPDFDAATGALATSSIVVGVLSGWLAVGFLAGIQFATHRNTWAPFGLIASLAFGPRSLTSHGTAIIAGAVLVHTTLSASFGLLFALFFPRVKTVPALFWGPVYGMALAVINWAIMARFMWPQLAEMVEPVALIGAHMVFGALLAFYPDLRDAYRRRLEAEAEGRRVVELHPAPEAELALPDEEVERAA